MLCVVCVVVACIVFVFYLCYSVAYVCFSSVLIYSINTLKLYRSFFNETSNRQSHQPVHLHIYFVTLRVTFVGHVKNTTRPDNTFIFDVIEVVGTRGTKAAGSSEICFQKPRSPPRDGQIFRRFRDFCNAVVRVAILVVQLTVVHDDTVAIIRSTNSRTSSSRNENALRPTVSGSFRHYWSLHRCGGCHHCRPVVVKP